MNPNIHINEALGILEDLELPNAQQNERTALTLLALLDLLPEKAWTEIRSPLLGITPIIDWIRRHYNKDYAPNTRETIRRQSIHQFVDAGLALRNPDDLRRPTNSPKTVYQISPETLALLVTFGTASWKKGLSDYLSKRDTLKFKYAKRRDQELIPLKVNEHEIIQLSPGSHSQLIRSIVDDFGPRFVPGGELVYVGDTRSKWGYFNKDLLGSLDVVVDSHGKMPDVIIYYSEKNWLVLAEAVTSHGPVNPKRHEELVKLFNGSSAGLVFLTAFPTRMELAKYLSDIAWETEVWAADTPSHLIHFNGKRFLGPYKY